MRICMLLHKSIEHDSRVRREAKALSQDGHDVTVVHLPRRRGELDGELDGFSVVSATPGRSLRDRLPLRLYRAAFLWNFVGCVLRLRPDAVHAHDTAMLVPGWIGARLTGAKLVYDSHEYAPGVAYRRRLWALFVNAVERTLIGRTDAVVTVSEGIAERLRERYGLTARPVVVRNVPDPEAYDSQYQAPRLRERLELPPGAPLVLHLGAAARDRGGAVLVRAMADLPGFQLLFLGAEDASVVQSLLAVARREGVSDRVHVHPPVPIAHVLAYARQATVGVSLLEDTCENHRLALPNKVFEYLAAGLPVVASDLPELRRLRDQGTPLALASPRDAADVARAIRAVANGAGETVEGPTWSSEARKLAGMYARWRPPALILVRNGVTLDARVHREADTLQRLGFTVTVVGAVTGRDRIESERRGGVLIRRVRPLSLSMRRVAPPPRGPGPPPSTSSEAGPTGSSRLRRVARTVDFNRRAALAGIRVRPRLVHCNDHNTMWAGLAVRARTGAAVVYDSHELWADRNLRPEWRPWLLATEALFLRAAQAVITTSPGYADALRSRYRVARPAVVRNVPDWSDKIAPSSPRSRTLAYFGALTPNRGLEAAVAAVARADDVRLRLIGPDAWGYRARLRRVVADAGVGDRVEIEEPIPHDEAQEVLATVGGGLALIEPACVSYDLTLPNKLYEYIHAGLPVLAGTTPVLAAAVREHGVGLTVDPRDVGAVAAAMEQLLEPGAQDRFRSAAEVVRREVNWPSERRHLEAIYHEALGGRGR